MSTVTYQIMTSLSTTQGLTGSGEEWIIDVVSGELIAKFWNGNLMTHSSNSLATDAAQGSAATVVLNSEAA